MHTTISVTCSEDEILEVCKAMSLKLSGLEGFVEFRPTRMPSGNEYWIDVNHTPGVIETVQERIVEVGRIFAQQGVVMRVVRISVDTLSKEDMAEIIIRRRGTTHEALVELLGQVETLSRRIDIGNGNFEAAKTLFDAINLSHVLGRICDAIRRPDIMDDAREATEANLANTHLVKVH